MPSRPGMSSSDCEPVFESLSFFYFFTPCEESPKSHDTFVQQVLKGVTGDLGQWQEEKQGRVEASWDVLGEGTPRTVGEAGASLSFLPARWIRERIRFCISFQRCVTNGHKQWLETAPSIGSLFRGTGAHSVTGFPTQGPPG